MAMEMREERKKLGRERFKVIENRQKNERAREKKKHERYVYIEIENGEIDEREKEMKAIDQDSGF